MKYAILIIFSFFATRATLKNDTTTKHKPSVVLQLFTSQGCSSCPRADDFLDIIKKEYANKNVFVLSYHVDYWNYIGWKDPFSKKEFSELQRAYGRKLNSGNIYTPQLIVNGKVDYVGSSKLKIKASIAKNLTTNPKNELTFLESKKEDNTVTVTYNIKGNINSKKIQLALVLDRKITKVRRGENSNRTLFNNNIVIATASQKLTTNSGTLQITIPKAYENEEQLRIIGFVQNKQLHISAGTAIVL